MISVVLVSTWHTPCGIAEYGYYLKTAVEIAGVGIEITPRPTWLDPHRAVHELETQDDIEVEILHLNYQANLHSRWTPEVVRQFKHDTGAQILITYHDTGVPNSEPCKALYAVADAFVVHEPAHDLPNALYWRQGVPEPKNPTCFDERYFPFHRSTDLCFKSSWAQPVLGSIGFPFPWKNYDQLAMVTREAGWALLLIAPGATEAQIQNWRSLNPDLHVEAKFVDRSHAVSLLSGCDATAFCYVCHNTGTSGAIRMGLAARKPVIALKTCRQFRDLLVEPHTRRAIRWCETFADVREMLTILQIQRVDPGIVRIAQEDSWERRGQQYAHIYQTLGDAHAAS